MRIARDYLDLLARHDIAELTKRTGADEESILAAFELIQSLEPRPGSRYDNRRDEYLVPDVYVTKVDDQWRVTTEQGNVQIAARRKAHMEKKPGAEIIPLGIGDTTEPLTPRIVQALKECAEGLGTREGYSGCVAQPVFSSRRRLQ